MIKFIQFILKFISSLFAMQSKTKPIVIEQPKQTKPIQPKAEKKEEIKQLETFIEPKRESDLVFEGNHSYDSISVLRRSSMRYIVVHCSDSEFGNAELIHDWHIHRADPFKKIGYHFVILNGRESSKSQYKESRDGVIEIGRKIDETGSHCLGYNSNSIGICMIGKKTFTEKQFNILKRLIKHLQKEYNIPTENVIGHYEAPKANGKTCPNFDMSKFRKELSE